MANNSSWQTGADNMSSRSDLMKTPLVSNQKQHKNEQENQQLTNPRDAEPEDMIKSLEDVKSGFETLAESSIMKAIELNEKERDEESSFAGMSPFEKKRHTRGHARGSSLLSGVPASAMHLFDTDESDSDADEKPSMPLPGELSGTVPAALEIVQPTETATPSLKDIAKRINLMQKLAVVKEETIRNINTSNQDDPENVEIRKTPMDPESLVGDDHRPEAFADSAIESRSDVDTEDAKKGRKQTRCWRRYCAPCSVFTTLVVEGFHAAGKYILKMYLYLIMPLIAVSAILFYIADNPIASLDASYSWWLLFAVRHIITLLLAQITQFILIDYIALETRFAVLFVGRLLTLMAVQAKGWPLILVIWSLWNFALNFGESSFSRHWLYMQDWVNMFNVNNPSGRVVTHESYQTFLTLMIGVGVVVMIKRVLISLWLGRKNYVMYAGKMESLMRKVLLISEVAMLSQDIDLGSQGDATIPAAFASKNNWLFGNSTKSIQVDEDEDEDETDNDSARERLESSELYSFRKCGSSSMEDNENESDGDTNTTRTKKIQKRLKWNFKNVKETRKKNQKNKSKKAILLGASTERIALINLLGEWEEPEIKKKFSWKDTSTRKILQFREMLHYLDGAYPLSVPFGPAETRKQCMTSAQNVYNRLMLDMNPNATVLHFDTLMSLATNKDGNIQKEKARALIRLFRPDREGNLTLLDFVRSCDRIYKRIKMFRVITSNGFQIDDAFEKILNVVFFFILSLFVLFGFGVDPIGIFTGLTGLLLPLSFLFSAASSKYFEGLLLVLLRQPYDIGDRIALSHPMNDTNLDGSTTWFVENITLFTTTVRNAATNEVGTYANGSLASLRIINAARSSNAMVTVKLKFGVDVPYEKVKVFHTVVEEFIKARPREWLNLLGFRATAIEADLGYIQYIICLQHVESWQNLGIIKESLADVSSFCLEVSKKMEMRFINPPVSLRLEENSNIEGRTRSSSIVDGEMQKISRMFGE